MDIFDNMRRDKNYFIFLYLGNNALKAQAFLGIESRGRLIKNENIRVSEQSLAIPARRTIPPESALTFFSAQSVRLTNLSAFSTPSRADLSSSPFMLAMSSSISFRVRC